MKRFLLAGAAFAALSSASYAADLSYAPAPVPVSVIDWSGFYVGLQGGYATGDVSVDEALLSPLGLYASDIEGGFGGAYWGRNWQFGNMVLGLDGSLSFAAIEDDYSAVVSPSEPAVEIEMFSASRIRVGYAFDNLLLFAAGGFTLAKANVDDGAGDEDAYLKGFTVGAGMDYKFSQNWSARLEYMYLNYGEEQRTVFAPGAERTYLINVEDVHAVRAGIAYHF